MLKTLLSAFKNVRSLGSIQPQPLATLLKQTPVSAGLGLRTTRDHCISSATNGSLSPYCSRHQYVGLLQSKPVLTDTVRSITKFSWEKGKRLSEPAVLEKFYRLNWGIWIHCKAGRQKKLYKKSANNKRRLQYHVFCNGRQSWLLDRMVTKRWRRPHHFIDDPYEPYHSREEFKYTRMKPYQPFQ